MPDAGKVKGKVGGIHGAPSFAALAATRSRGARNPVARSRRISHVQAVLERSLVQADRKKMLHLLRVEAEVVRVTPVVMAVEVEQMREILLR